MSAPSAASSSAAAAGNSDDHALNAASTSPFCSSSSSSSASPPPPPPPPPNPPAPPSGLSMSSSAASTSAAVLSPPPPLSEPSPSPEAAPTTAAATDSHSSTATTASPLLFPSQSSSLSVSSSSPLSSSPSSASPFPPPIHPSHLAIPAVPPQARLLLAYSKVPLATLILRIPPVYVMSRDDHSSQSTVHPQASIPLKVRIMGSVQPTAHGHTIVSNRTPASLAPIKPPYRDMAGSEIFLVAKDLCTLIHTRKGNVAKSIGGFADWEKARMAVLCPRSNGSVSTHILTVLSMAGMYRLLNASRSPLAPVIMKVLYEVINSLFDEEAERRDKQAADAAAEAERAATAAAAASAHASTASPSTSSAASSPTPSSSPSPLSSSSPSPSSSSHPPPSIASPASTPSSTNTSSSGSQLDYSSPPQSPDLHSATTVPTLRAHSKKGRRDERGEDDETTQVSGPVIIYSLVSTADGVSFVRLKLKDPASVRQELRNVREGAGGIQGADDEQATIDRAEHAYAAQDGRGGGSSGGVGVVGRQGPSQRAVAIRPTVATPAVALPSAYERPTVAAVAIKVDEDRERERWRQQLDDRVSIEDVRRRSIDEAARALRANPSATALSQSQSGPLLSPQVPPVSSLHQLHQLQFQQLQYQQQQQQQQLMAQQQQQQQQHKRDEMILLMQQQQQQHQHFMRDAQRLQLAPSGAPHTRPTPSMSPTRSSAASLYSPFSSVPTQPIPLSLSAAADYLQPPPAVLPPPAAPSASPSLNHSSLSSFSLGPASFTPATYPSTFPFVQPLGPARPPTLPPDPLSSLDWPMLGLGGGPAAGGGNGNGSGGNGGHGGNGGTGGGGAGGAGGSGGFNNHHPHPHGGGGGGFGGHNTGGSGFGGYGQQGGSGGYGGYQQ